MPWVAILITGFYFLYLVANGADPKASISDLPIKINQKAISSCFDKMTGVVTAQDAASLNSLRVTLERIYQLQRPLLLLRQLEFKKESGIKVVYEFNALQNSKPGFESFRVKAYSFNAKGQMEDLPTPYEQQTLTRSQVNQFMTDDEIIKDERTEEYKMLNSRSIIVRSKDFKIQEIESFDLKTKKRFQCRLLEGRQALCQCST
jgi:hypothetical protein